MTDLIAKLDALYEKKRNASSLMQFHDADLDFSVALYEAWPQLRDMARDAARYQLCQREGFPVRNQTPASEDVRWTIRGKWFGATPSLCIDAVMQGGDKSALQGKETSK